MILLLLACTDYGVNPDDKPTSAFDSGGEDSGADSAGTTLEELCNGLDDDGDGAVDEGFADSDGDGIADCLAHECPALTLGVAGATGDNVCGGGTTVTDPWKVRMKWGFLAPDPYYLSLSTPIVGNLDDDDGNGIVDEGDIPDIVVAANVLYALDGATGTLKWTADLSGWYPTPVIADVDVDGLPEVVTRDFYGHIVVLDGTGTIKAITTATFPNSRYTLAVADLDGDGHPEIIADGAILEGDTLAVRATYDGGYEEYTHDAIGDVDGDGDQEIFRSGRLYDSDGSLIWDAALPLASTRFPALVQADDDPDAEFVLVSDRFSVLDTDGTLLAQGDPFPADTWGTGLPTAGDFDGDGQMEVAFPIYSDNNFTMYELDGSIGWEVRSPISRTFIAGASAFDFDGDGALEVLYPADEAFYIFDGRTGDVLYTTTDHMSDTAFEYASVADIDRDGHAEIVMVNASYSPTQVWALEHDGDGWPAAGPIWSESAFSVTDINPDGSVPAHPEPSWLTSKTYRARPSVDGVVIEADLRVAITDVCIADCAVGSVAVAVQVSNAGGLEAPAGARLVLYAVDDAGSREVASLVVGAVPAGQSLDGVQFDLSPADIGAGGFAATIDADGFVAECDEDNNNDAWADTSCP